MGKAKDGSGRGDPHEAAARPRNVTATEWRAAIEAFRENPGRTHVVGKVLGVGENRARRFWARGVPNQGLPPIRQLLREEEIAARAARESADAESELELARARDRATVDEMTAREQERQRALQDAAKTRATEGALVKAARNNALGLQVALAPVMMKAARLGEAIGEAIEKKAKAGNVDLKEGMGLLRQAATIARFGNEAAKLAVSMERLLMGEPDGDDLGKPGATLSHEEAERVLEDVLSRLRRSRERGSAPRLEPGQTVVARVVEAKGD